MPINLHSPFIYNTNVYKSTCYLICLYINNLPHLLTVQFVQDVIIH